MKRKIEKTTTIFTASSPPQQKLCILFSALMFLSFFPYNTHAKQPNYYAEGLNAEFSGNQNIAVEKYELAAHAGLSDAKFALGRLYRDTYGDETLSFKWFMAAAKQGNAFAQYEIGIIYRDGNSNIQQDITLAQKWLSAAASHNNTDAVFALFEMSNNDEQAIKWLKKAAALGNRNAMLKLADAYNNGEYGLDIDLNLEQKWKDQAMRTQEGEEK